MDAPITLFGTPDLTSFYPIGVSSIAFGAGQLETDSTYTNLYWNSSQVNSQRGFVTISSGNTVVTTSDTNITANSIIVATPYGDITGAGFIINSFWIVLNASTSWELNIANSLGRNVDFSYNILQY